MLKFLRLFKQLSFLFVILCSVFIVNDLSAATYNFNTLYKGTGSSYDNNTNSITGLTTVSGSSFKFFQAGSQFSGNSINGTLSYYDATNTLISIDGQLNRRNKSGTTSQAFYFVPFVSGGSTFTGESYLLVVPGFESLFTASGSAATSSDPMDNALNAVVNSLPTIITTSSLTDFAACAGTAVAAQTFTVTATSLTAGVLVTAPSGFAVSATQSGTYTNSFTLPQTSGSITNANVWVKLTSTASGSYSGTITCASTGAGTQVVPVTGTITAGSVGGTITGTTVVTSATNSNVLTLTGYTGTIQWQSSTNNITFNDISGETSATYTATNVGVTTYYRAVVTNGTGACSIAYSNIATITFDNGCYSFDIVDFSINGNATLLPSDIVRLTTATGGQNGSIWNKNKINLDYDFDISTSVNLGNSNAGADGIAFVLQNYAVNAGSVGGGLGYMGIQPSFAVEFDTYYNGGSDPVSGSDHIAIIKNGFADNLAAHSAYATPFEVEMEDGLWHDVRFVWTASSKNFKVFWNGNNTTPLYNITVDLKANVFSGASNVFFGLTAATGGSVNLQQVKVPTYCLVKQVSITPKAGYLNSLGETSICAPATVVLQASNAVSYQWYKDNILMTDSTSKSIIVSTSGVYKVDAVDGKYIASTSPPVTVTVGPTLLPGTISGNELPVCSGTNSTLLTLTGSTGTNQWWSSVNGTNFNAISGATSDTYTATNLTATTYYKNIVTNGTCSTSGGTISVTVVPASVAGAITGSKSVCTGTNSAVLTLTGFVGDIQWVSSNTLTGTYTPITGATSATYTSTDLTATTYYKAVVTNTGCTTSATTSSTGIITVNELNLPGTITGGDVTVCAGAANSTTLTLSGANGSIQWQVSSDNITFANITGATTSTYVAVNLNTTKYYRAVISSGACNSAISASVSISASQCIVANPDINVTFVNTPVNGSVNTNDKTTSGTTYGTPTTSSANPAGATITMNADGTYTFNALLPGKYIYYVSVCAAGQTTGCAVSTLEISVTDPNSTTNPPLAKNDYSTTQVNTPAAVKVLSNDKVANPGTSLLPSTITVTSAPSNGTTEVNTTTGVITFTPNTGFTGTDSLNYNVCDNSAPSICQVATVYFKISSTSVAEYTTADDDFNTVNMNTSVTGNVLTNDINSSGTTLTVTSNVSPLSSQGTITINEDGSYTFTPTANFFGPVDITYTACSSTSACAIATLHILVVPVKPAPPKPINGTYSTGVSTNPTTIAPTITEIPSGSKVIYCDVNGTNCSTTAPALPTVPGIYVWCIKSLDTVTNLTSDPCVYDTLRILPVVKTVNATYVNGVTTNPTNINSLITSITSGSNPTWCDVNGNNCTTTAPKLPTASGTYIWCVKAVDVASGLTSASCVMDTVKILVPYTVLEITKTARAVKLNPDGSILVTFAMKASNKTDAILDNVTIKDDLAKTFNSFSGITVYSLETFGGLVKNSGYDGISNIDLVTSQSKINAMSTDSLILRVLIASTSISGNFLNTSVLGGKSKYGILSVESNDPTINSTDTTKRVASPFVVPKTDVIIAGGFSPNQDGINDKWIIVRPYGTTIEVRVFNRWGNIVYQNSDYKNDWTGRGENNFSGDYVPEGTYFYTVNAIDNSGIIKKFTSSLTIVR